MPGFLQGIAARAGRPVSPHLRSAVRRVPQPLGLEAETGDDQPAALPDPMMPPALPPRQSIETAGPALDRPDGPANGTLSPQLATVNDLPSRAALAAAPIGSAAVPPPRVFSPVLDPSPVASRKARTDEPEKKPIPTPQVLPRAPSFETATPAPSVRQRVESVTQALAMPVQPSAALPAVTPSAATSVPQLQPSIDSAPLHRSPPPAMPSDLKQPVTSPVRDVVAPKAAVEVASRPPQTPMVDRTLPARSLFDQALRPLPATGGLVINRLELQIVEKARPLPMPEPAVAPRPIEPRQDWGWPDRQFLNRW